MATLIAGIGRIATIARRPRWRTLADAYENGNDNFLLLRLIAAALVIFGHSYGFSGLPNYGDFIVRAGWGKGIYTGSIAVDMFFVISGFLVTASYIKRASLLVFLESRALRILPAYVCCIVLTALLLGALFTDLPALQYWSTTQTWNYIYTNLKLSPGMIWTLPGVFIHNFLPNTVNGSIWTLPAEVRMYVWVAVLGVLGVLSRRWLANCAFAVLLAVGWFAPEYVPLVKSDGWMPLAGFFLAGAFCFVNREHIPVSTALLLGLIGLTWAVHGSVAFFPMFGVAVTYFCFWFAYVPNFHFFNRFGDYSYGVYLWGFPVQQAVSVTIGRPVPAWINFLLSLAIALALAALSWHWVEKPALRLKPRRKQIPATQQLRTQTAVASSP